MTNPAHRCWECRKEVAGGVCPGPHPRFDMESAITDGHVDMGRQPRRSYEGGSPPPVLAYHRPSLPGRTLKERLEAIRPPAWAQEKREAMARTFPCSWCGSPITVYGRDKPTKQVCNEACLAALRAELNRRMAIRQKGA